MKLTLEIKTINDLYNNEDAVGEYLRKKSFIKEFGCYNCFEVVDSLKECNYKKLTEKEKILFVGVNDYIGNDEELKKEWENDCKKIRVYECDEYIMAYVYDGDGTLGFYLKEFEVWLINYDCKKMNYWEVKEA